MIVRSVSEQQSQVHAPPRNLCAEHECTDQHVDRWCHAFRIRVRWAGTAFVTWGEEQGESETVVMIRQFASPRKIDSVSQIGLISRHTFPQEQASVSISRVFFTLALWAAVFPFHRACGSSPPKQLHDATQLVLVTTPDWHSTNGTMQLFARSDANTVWEKAGDAFPVVVGRSGLAWRALPGEAVGKQNFKREGDGKSPAGIFRLTFAFGFAPRSEAGPLHIPYRRIARTWKCVDDPESRYYNMVFDSTTVGEPDWNSAEDMRHIDPAYAWGVFVAHNTDPVVPGAGSCIFLHIWDGPRTTTSGCTAMEEWRMLEVICWLDSDAGPVLVQLPVSEYLRRKRAWGLP
jgi:L,D-peptidoglycan transpeptidase YkuD (ErfK/YbiS/YcfS/YnhG family)